ncbi:hypothetical protein HELRODRAFT_180290 [Helobdella robusta]|uniref:Uncharacterized protein n=1 Tax=Helobdella robusta TaxID=6412 RepID=T1FFP4_HELRO|nr:hypothetical protein HELRODRAFT_180290 [Helobdella robusta]ESN94120.1 hypothetical protein HELRODRAFT_180290 [Helobdella robusta]
MVENNKITRLNRPSEPCYSTPGYHPVKCEWRCIAEKIIERCNCRPIYMEAIRNESICDYLEEQSCASTITDKFYQMRNDDPIYCDCPPLCTETIYTPSVTGSDLGRNFVKAMLKDFGPNQTFEEITSNQSLLTIYLSSLQCTYITTTESYGLVALMSDLGGALGLLLGATFLTVVEALELIYDFILFARVKRRMAKTS